jgi:hypothetical protein
MQRGELRVALCPGQLTGLRRQANHRCRVGQPQADFLVLRLCEFG